MTDEQFDEQPIAKGDKIRFKLSASGLMITDNISGVDWGNRLYFTESYGTVQAWSVIEYIPLNPAL